MNTGKRIPISAVKAIGQQFGYTQVITVAFDKGTGITSVATWGKSQEDCEQAAEGGNFVKKAMGWPPDQCNAKPSRQVSREKMKELLLSLVEIMQTPDERDDVNLVRFVACAELARRLLHPQKNTIP